jgi:hypothetical protein
MILRNNETVRKSIQMMLQQNLFPEDNLRIEVGFLSDDGYQVRLIKPPVELLPSDPEQGTQKYYVHNWKLQICTVMGADNKHHAANKAALLWKDKWDALRPRPMPNYEFVPVKEFNKLIKAISLRPEGACVFCPYPVPCHLLLAKKPNRSGTLINFPF